MLQESCAQPQVTILHRVGGPSSAELKDIVMGISWAGTRTQPQGHTIIRLLLLYFLFPLPSMISNCLNLPSGTQGRWRRLNEAYVLQTRNGNREWICTPQPHGVLLSFNSGNWATMTLLNSYQNGAQDCLSLENRHRNGSISELQVLDLSLDD